MKKIFNRLNKINVEYGIAFYEVQIKEDIHDFYTKAKTKFDEGTLSEDIFYEIEELCENILINAE